MQRFLRTIATTAIGLGAILIGADAQAVPRQQTVCYTITYEIPGGCAATIDWYTPSPCWPSRTESRMECTTTTFDDGAPNTACISSCMSNANAACQNDHNAAKSACGREYHACLTGAAAAAHNDIQSATADIGGVIPAGIGVKGALELILRALGGNLSTPQYAAGVGYVYTALIQNHINQCPTQMDACFGEAELELSSCQASIACNC